MKKIIIAYWHAPINGIKYKANEEFNYTERRLTSIINHVIANNCSIMITPVKQGVIAWIGNGRFGQR